MTAAVWLWGILFLFSQLRISWTENTTCVSDDVFTKLKEVDKLIHQIIGFPPEIRQIPTDCTDIKKQGIKTSGIYEIRVMKNQTIPFCFKVYCDMKTDGGGWTVFQRRGDFKQPVSYFYKDWKRYAEGFGKLDEDFWLGNEKLYYLTNQGNYYLRIDMKDKENATSYAQYGEFRIGNEENLYKLHVRNYSGEAGDSLTRNHTNMFFSTFDKDNDKSNTTNCAQKYEGAWWYNECHYSNLNGLYLNGKNELRGKGIVWSSWKDSYYSLPVVEMKIRRI
ncbi:techylectin-5A-like [Centruroides sculpturatus]|uniref:techylectin-5A-like n=1 Tax=Centruroides sculpturatus TaxID=218467 RepID=UPI000C6EA650|nr:techylectin-5A-like [Centruroides sculpturatus]